MFADVAGPDQRAAKKMRPGHFTNKNPSRESRRNLSWNRCMTLSKLATPAGNTFARGLLLT